MGLTCTVLGGSGYGGGELVRLLAQHPALDVVAVGSRRPLPGGAAAPKVPVVPLEEALRAEVDVCFSALPSGVLEPSAAGSRVLVDLSDDHRGDPDWVYGLSELARPRLRDAQRIANPGCYPTAALLAISPFVARRLVGGPVVVDGLSGVSGAGRKTEERLLFAELHGSVSAYGDTAHRHVPEIERWLGGAAGRDVAVSFTPHLVAIARGLLATVRAPLAEDLDDADALGVLEETYGDEPLIHVDEGWPVTKSVAGSNRAVVHARVDARAGFLIASCAIDNLGKGAAGQAIQNANIALGVEETAGLEGYGQWP